MTLEEIKKIKRESEIEIFKAIRKLEKTGVKVDDIHLVQTETIGGERDTFDASISLTL